MANKDEAANAPVRRTPPPKTLTRFEAPKEMSAEFGLQTEAEDHLSGIVATEHVRQLLDAFGLRERIAIAFPFQHIVRRHGEIWSMRIEPIAAHTVDSRPVMAHQWTYQRQFPESVGSAA